MVPALCLCLQAVNGAGLFLQVILSLPLYSKMKLHLPLLLLAALAVCCSSPSRAAEPVPVWDAGGTWLWTGNGGDSAYGTAANWNPETVPGRVDNKGVRLVFDNAGMLTVGGNMADSSDGGGIEVLNNSHVTLNGGRWLGNLVVGRGSSVTFTGEMSPKSSTIIANGTITFANTYAMGLDNGGTAQKWYFGEEGKIVFGMDPSQAFWFNGVSIEMSGVLKQNSIAGLLNRTSTLNQVTRRLIETNGGQAGNGVQFGEFTNERGLALARVTSWDGLSDEEKSVSYLVTSGTSIGVTVQFYETEYDSLSLEWVRSQPGVWSQGAAGWIVAGDAGRVDTSYLNGDAVAFTAASAGTVTIEGEVTPASVTVSTSNELAWTAGAAAGSGLSGDAPITVNGTGRLSILSANAAYEGAVTIASGTVVLGNSGALGTGTVDNAGSLVLQWDGEHSLGNRLSSTGSLTIAGGTASLGNAGNLVNGTVLVQSGATLNLAAGGGFGAGAAPGVTILEGGTVNVSSLAGSLPSTTVSGGTLNWTAAAAAAGTVTLNGGMVNAAGNQSLAGTALQSDVTLHLAGVASMDFGTMTNAGSGRVTLQLAEGTTPENLAELMLTGHAAPGGNLDWLAGRFVAVSGSTTYYGYYDDAQNRIVFATALELNSRTPVQSQGIPFERIGGTDMGATAPTIGSLTIRDAAGDPAGNTLKLATIGGLTVQGVLAYQGGASPDGYLISGGPLHADALAVDSGSLRLDAATQIDHGATIASGASLVIGARDTAIAGDVRSDGSLMVEGGTLNVGGTLTGNLGVEGGSSARLGGLSGNEGSSLSGGGDVEITGGGNTVFAGDMSSYQGLLTVAGNASQTLRGVGGTGAGLDVAGGGSLTLDYSARQASYRSVALESGSSLHLSASDSGQMANGTLSLAEDSTWQGGSSVTFTFSPVADVMQGKTALVTMAQGSALTLDLAPDNKLTVHAVAAPGSKISLSDGLRVVLVDGVASGQDIGSGSFTADFDSILSKFYVNARIVAEGGKLYLLGDRNGSFSYANYAQSSNARTGGALLDNVLFTVDPQSTAPDSQLAKVMNAVDGLAAGKRMSEASQLMAAAAGTTVTTLNASQLDTLRFQMQSLRNRAVSMGVDPQVGHDKMPYLNAWASFNGANNDVSRSGDEAGYTLTSWGGTVGADCDMTPHLTAGVAFTANLGKLSADGAEHATGHVDSYLVSLYLRAQSGRWSHTGVLTGGTSKADLDRTVRYGTGQYTTHGSTDGSAFGAMYELAYDIPLDTDYTSLVQPLFNASISSARMKGYEESGAGNAGLSVDDMDTTYATLGLGGRYLAAVGQNIFNRNAMLECRALLVQDIGDRRVDADVAFAAANGFRRTVQGVKPGSTGVEVGLGLTIPVELQGSLFMDAMLDARSGATYVSGSIGYRYNF